MSDVKQYGWNYSIFRSCFTYWVGCVMNFPPFIGILSINDLGTFTSVAVNGTYTILQVHPSYYFRIFLVSPDTKDQTKDRVFSSPIVSQWTYPLPISICSFFVKSTIKLSVAEDCHEILWAVVVLHPPKSFHTIRTSLIRRICQLLLPHLSVSSIDHFMISPTTQTGTKATQ